MENRVSVKTQTYIEKIFQHMAVGVGLYDAHNLMLLEANAVFESFLSKEWRGGNAIGRPLIDWFPFPDVADMIEQMQEVREVGKSLYLDEYPVFHRLRGITHWNVSVEPVYDEYTGEIRYLMQTISEVTRQVQARKQAEQAQASLSKVNTAVEAERQKLAVIEVVARSVQSSLDMKHIGRAALEAINTHFEPFRISMHIADAQKQKMHLLNIQSTSNSAQLVHLLQEVPYNSPLLLAKAHASHEPIIIEDVQKEPVAGIVEVENNLLVHDVHGYICIPLWFNDVFEGVITALFRSTIHKDSPEVRALIASGYYIASALAHARLHDTVERERIRLRAVLDQLPEGVMLVEASNRCISYTNGAAAKILGFERVESLCMLLEELPERISLVDLQGNPIHAEETLMYQALQGKIVDGREVQVTRLDGAKVILQVSVAPIRIDEDITGVVVVFQDITERKSIEQQKNEFLSIASHELRTPTTSVTGFAEILQRLVERGQSLDTPRVRRAIHGIVEQSQRLIRLIDEMLDLSRIENARLLLNCDTYDLLTTLHTVIESQEFLTKQHRLHLVVEGLEPGEKLQGYFDEARIEQVFSNLINNAVKYSPPGSEIEVGIRYTPEKPDEVLIWVKDQGIGISPQEIPHIFERFHRARNLDRAISGLGIGLYLVHEIVARHGGRVWAESEEGKGSTFYVSLPLTGQDKELFVGM